MICSWERLPASLLARIVGLGPTSTAAQQQQNWQAESPQHSEAAAAARLVCQSWRQAIDAHVVGLAPAAWPCGGLQPAPIIIPPCWLTCESVDCTRLAPGGGGDDGAGDVCSGCDPSCSCASAAAAGTAVSGRLEAGGSSRCASNSGASIVLGRSKGSQLDLNGAAVLQPRGQQQAAAPIAGAIVAAAAAALPSNSGAAGVAAGAAAASLMCFVASMWPAAVPLVPPPACFRLWKQLPQLPHLQQLRLSGSMLLVDSVATTVAGSPDAAGALQLLQQLYAAEGHASDDIGLASSAVPSITHTYVLRLPPALCSMTGLQSLSIEWRLRTSTNSSTTITQLDSDSSSATTATTAVFPVRRRSYEGGSITPSVQHIADSAIQLPRQFSSLVSLQRLELAGDITDASTLLPLLGLQHLRQLVLGAGRVAVQALVPLAAAGVLGGLQHLALKQQGSWDVSSMVAVLAAVTQLQQLEVEELEMPSAELSAAGPLQEALSAAHLSPLGSSLTSLRWSTCSQRLAGGASLLCRSPAAAAAGLPAEHPEDALATAAGPWLGALRALQSLHLCGTLRNGSVLGAPALEAISSSIGGCSMLETLSVQQLGLPLLPDALARLPRLRSVSIAACSVVRRAVPQPEQVLAVLGRCSSLERLTLSGCELRHVPAWLAGLQGVTSLQLSSNYLQDLSAEQPCMGLPPALRQLNLCDNRLRELPDSVAQLSSLTQLLLDSNYLNCLPAVIWDLPALAELSARENMLSQLPECSRSRPVSSAGVQLSAASCGASSGGVAAVIVAAAATSGAPVQDSTADADAAASWQGLSAEERELLGAIGILHRGPNGYSSSSGRPFAALGATEATPKQLQQPSEVISEVCACAGSLRSLVLAENQLTELPGSIAQLSSLRQINLSKNQLRCLPDKAGLWALSGLTSLNLADNQLRKLPGGLARLQHLLELDVSGNFLSVSIPRNAAAAPHTTSTTGHAAAAAAAAVSAAVSAAAHTATAPAAAAAAAAVSVAAGVCGRRRLSSDGGRAVSSQAAPATAVASDAAATGQPSSAAAAAAVSHSAACLPVAPPPELVTVLIDGGAAAAATPGRSSSSNACRNSSGHSSSGHTKGLRKQLQTLPSPLGRLHQLQQVRLGRQQAEDGSSWVGQCPLQLLLDGLFDLADRIRCLAPAQRQCPVARAAAAAVAHITGASSSSKRARALQRESELLARMGTEPGWVVVPVKRPHSTV